MHNQKALGKKGKNKKTTLGRPSKNSFITNFLRPYKFVLSCAKFLHPNAFR